MRPVFANEPPIEQQKRLFQPNFAVELRSSTTSVLIKMVPSQQGICALIAVSMTLLCGCGHVNPATSVVTGTVAYQGKPVEGAGVMFMPSNGRPASSLTDAQGRFVLRTFKDGDGAVVGKNVVCISKMAPAPYDKTKDPMLKKMIPLLPTRYATPTTSPLKVTVTTTGTNDFSFALTDGLPAGNH